MKCLAIVVAVAAFGAATASPAPLNATSAGLFDSIAKGELESAIQAVVPGFQWQWLQRNPQVARAVEDPTMDWIFGDFYDRTKSEEQRCEKTLPAKLITLTECFCSLQLSLNLLHGRIA
jgi:hypothetical protein